MERNTPEAREKATEDAVNGVVTVGDDDNGISGATSLIMSLAGGGFIVASFAWGPKITLDSNVYTNPIALATLVIVSSAWSICARVCSLVIMQRILAFPSATVGNAIPVAITPFSNRARL